MEKDAIDSLLFSGNLEYQAESKAERFTDHYLEQYRIYLHIFNSLGERRQKSNEFFLGLNTAIIGILGYVEVKETVAHSSLILAAVPFVGIAICWCWYRIINSYRQLNRAKFSVIHTIERKLPAALFETEWEVLGRGKDATKYRPLSMIEQYIPLIFTVLYLLLIFSNLPLEKALHIFS